MIETDRAVDRWTSRADRSTAKLREAKRLESTGLPDAARQAQSLRWAVVVAHTNLVRRWAGRWGNRAIPIEDRQQTAMLGAYEATLKYDPSRGIPFAGYAKWWVRAILLRSHPVHELPGNQQATLNLLSKVDAHLLSEAEAAARIGRTVGQLRAARRGAAYASPVSLDAPIRRTDSGPLLIRDVVPADQVSDTDTVDVERLVRVIDSLPELQRQAVRLRHGLETGEPMSFSDAGAAAGKSRTTMSKSEALGISAIMGKLA